MRLMSFSLVALAMSAPACFVNEPSTVNADIQVIDAWSAKNFYENGENVDANAQVINNGPDAATFELRTTMHNAVSGVDESLVPDSEMIELEPGETYEFNTGVQAPASGTSHCFWRVTANVPGDPDLTNNQDATDAFTLGSMN